MPNSIPLYTLLIGFLIPSDLRVCVYSIGSKRIDTTSADTKEDSKADTPLVYVVVKIESKGS